MTRSETSFGIRIDETAALELEELATACGADIGYVRALVDEGILEPLPLAIDNPDNWRFAGEALSRARRVLRLQRDFEANLSSAALMVELLDEIDRLRRVIHRAGLSID